MFNDYVRTPEANEDWQFENPIASGKITGRKPIEVPKLNLDSILPKPKEVAKVKFTELDQDKQLKLVEEEYKKGTSDPRMRDKFGISTAHLYRHIHKAQEMGLITELRAERKVRQGSTVETISSPKTEAQGVPAGKDDAETASAATVEAFAKVAGSKFSRAEKLAKEAYRLQQAGKIALDIQVLLGDRADRVIAALWEEARNPDLEAPVKQKTEYNRARPCGRGGESI